MNNTIYNYFVSTNFQYGLNHGILCAEIIQTISSPLLLTVSSDGNNVSITFNDALSPSQITLMEGLFANHNRAVNSVGDYYKFVIDNSVSSTTSSTYQMKLRLTTDYISGGTYRVNWSYNWKNTKKTSSFESIIQLDGVTTIGEQSDETTSIKSTSISQETGFTNITLAQGIHMIDMLFRRSTDISSTVSIWNAKLELTSNIGGTTA